MSQKETRSDKKAFKDWFDESAAQALADQVMTAMPSFDRTRFLSLATQNLETLEFSPRVRQFSSALQSTLPASIPEALTVLVESLPPPLPHCDSVTDGWLQWPVGQFIADYGPPHFEASMAAMIEVTQRFSAEFAVRPFVEQYPQATFERLLELTQHSSPHVRRWCSEGTRPRLPWGKKLSALVADPSPIWPILEALKDDQEIYVRRSVANNINDIAKDHPDLAIERCQTWSQDGNDLRDWVIRHGLRTLIKKGAPAALAVIGFGPPDRLMASLNLQPAKIEIGGEVQLSAVLETTATQAQDLVIDYVVHFVRKNGKTSEKVFKWTTTSLSAQGQSTLEKRHSMRRTTVRALYPGEHRVELQVNGLRVAEGSFLLV